MSSAVTGSPRLLNLRVLMVQPTGVSGIWHYANALAAALRREGAEVVLATQEPFEDLGPLMGARVATFGARGAQLSGWDHTPRLVDRGRHHLAKLTAFLRLIKEFRPHVIHFQAFLGSLDFAYYAIFKRMGSSVVITAHDAEPLHGRTRWSDWARYRSADHVWVHSTSCYSYLRRGGLRESKISTIPHGNYLHLCKNAEMSRREARDRLGIPQDSQLVLFFGAISRYKGLGVLLEAFARVLAVSPKARLMIAGEPLHPFDVYAEQIEKLGLEKQVIVRLGYAPIEQFAEHFRAANVVVLPYLRVSQSGILQLAYGFGRAVVVTFVGGLGDTVRVDKTGVVVEANAPAALATGIVRILETPGLADEMGSRARQLAETKYAWEQIARTTGAIYLDLVMSHTARGRTRSSSDDRVFLPRDNSTGA